MDDSCWALFHLRIAQLIAVLEADLLSGGLVGSETYCGHFKCPVADSDQLPRSPDFPIR